MKMKEESKKSWLKTQHSENQDYGIWSHHFLASGETMETMTEFIFLGSKITADSDLSHEIQTLAPWKKSYDKPKWHIKKQRHYLADKGLSIRNYDFSGSQSLSQMRELDHKEG